MRRVAYVAGPYRDPRGAWYIQENINKARAVAVELWRMGYAVICPHANTAHFDGAASDDVWLEGDLELLGRSDLVVMIDGWKESTGAVTEHAFAIQEGIPIRYWPRVEVAS